MPANVRPSLWESIMIFLRVVWRVTRQLFHETTGVFFALFSIYFGIAAWRSWKYHATYWVIGFAAIYVLMMAAFAFAAFRRARRIR
jgi:hypothetical protein